MYTSSQFTQTLLTNAKSVMKQTSGTAAGRFMFKGLLALCHFCLHFYSMFTLFLYYRKVILVLIHFFPFENKANTVQLNKVT